MKRVIENHLEGVTTLLQSVAHPIRLKVLCVLIEGEKSVSELLEGLNTSPSNISQHLAILKNRNILDSRKKANLIYYRIVDPSIEKLLNTIQTLYCKESGE